VTFNGSLFCSSLAHAAFASNPCRQRNRRATRLICFPPATRAVTPSEGWHVGCMSPEGPALDGKSPPTPD
jgi:hypothetical protein